MSVIKSMTDLHLGKDYNVSKCDSCKKKFKENYNDIITFNCGHKCHHECCIIINNEISCKACFENENENEETLFRGDLEIKELNEIEEEDKGKYNNKNKKKAKSSSVQEKLRLLNKIDDNYFEMYKIFESSNHL